MIIKCKFIKWWQKLLQVSLKINSIFQAHNPNTFELSLLACSSKPHDCDLFVVCCVECPFLLIVNLLVCPRGLCRRILDGLVLHFANAMG